MPEHRRVNGTEEGALVIVSEPNQPTPTNDPRSEIVRIVSTVRAVEAYERDFIAPVRRLNETLIDVLDVDGSPDRRPDEALALLKDAMETFQDASSSWLATGTDSHH